MKMRYIILIVCALFLLIAIPAMVVGVAIQADAMMDEGGEERTGTTHSKRPVEQVEEGDNGWWRNEDVENDSPEIFFHVTEPITTDVTVTIPDGVTLTIPEVEMTSAATWTDVKANPDGTCTYEGSTYPYLYYEGIWDYPDSSFGWMVEKVDGVMVLEGEVVTEDDILEFITEKCIDSGLEPNEAQVIIDRIVALDMLEFDGCLAIRYIPEVDVEATMQLETSESFQTMRRHFYLEQIETQVELSEPVFEMRPEGDLIIHETAVNRG